MEDTGNTLDLARSPERTAEPGTRDRDVRELDLAAFQLLADETGAFVGRFGPDGRITAVVAEHVAVDLVEGDLVAHTWGGVDVLIRALEQCLGGADAVRALTAGGRQWLARLRPLGPDGDGVLVLLDTTERTRTLTALSRYAAELDQTLEELRDEAALRDRVLSVAAHELRHPLTPILGFVDVLERQAAPRLTDTDRDHLAVIRRNTQHMLRLVDALLTASRASRGELRAHRETVDVARVVAEVVEELAPGDGAVVVADVDATAYVDPMHLNQIVANLVSNGLRHGDTPVTISVEETATTVSLVVEDRGPGVDPAVLDHVFDAYVQADPGDVGVGLGLSIGAALATANGGSMRYAATPGSGARFVVDLPRSPDGR